MIYLMAMLFIGALGSTQAFAQQGCQDPLGDLNNDGTTNVSDVQCSILVALTTLQSADIGALSCLNVAPEYADMNCSGTPTLSDVFITLESALGFPLNSELDLAGTGCPDACEVETFCMDCETDWSVIDESLLGKLDMLPSPPASPLPMDWPEYGSQVRWDTLEASAVPQGWDPGPGCTSGLWDPERVTTGSPYLNSSGEEKCWAAVGNGVFNTGSDKTYFYFRNREKNNGDPIVGDPAWVQARFPMPPGHSMYRLDIQIKTARLFGYPPTYCLDYWTADDGTCNLNTVETWNESDPGLYLLWSKPGATHYVITGPHLPTEPPPSWNIVTLSPEVPPALKDVEELVVTVFLYRQYPRECWMVVDANTGEETKSCTDGYGGNNMALTSLSMETRATALAGNEPPLERPRIFGDNATWMADQEPFNAMPCITIDQSSNAIGDLENIKNLWDQYTLGAVPCDGEPIPPLSDHPSIQPYLQDIQALKDAGTWKPNPTGALHAIRRTKACLAGESTGECQATPEELAAIITAFKTEEIASIDDATWCATACTVGFDLQTGPLMFRWAIFADTLWDDLTSEEHAILSAKLGEKIDNFLNIGDIRHWALFNGNNWTPALVHGALAWAIAYYHEDPRALDVAILGVGSMWWHDHIWKSDGAYEEGVSYGGHDMALLALVARLVKKSFGTPHFMPWSYLEKSGKWFVDMMATDGWTVDFGDSHSSNGWNTNAPMMTALVSEWVYETPGVIDPCTAHDYWAHKYYFHGFNDPWVMHPWMARDWPAIIAACDTTIAATDIANYPVGGWSTLRSYQPGSSGMTDELPDGHKGHDADKTMLAISSVPNSYAHMEADFGSIIWSAFGSRLIADIGYGSQAKDIYATQFDTNGVIYEMIDNGPLGHATLSIPEASFPHSYTGLTMNSSQIKGGAGTAVEGTWGDASGMHLDGAFVYGKVDGNPAYEEAEANGWLEHFDRWLIVLPGGHFLVADSFQKRADRPDVTAAETWTFFHEPPTNPEAPCKYNEVHTDVSLEDSQTVAIEPICSMLFYSLDSTTLGKILGASASPGHFTEPEVFDNYKNNGGLVTHKKLQYVPDAPVSHDARVFALIAAPSAEAFPDASLTTVPCSNLQDACFELSLDTAITSIHFVWNGARHVLSSVTYP